MVTTMKKKFLLAIIALVMALTCLAACSNYASTLQKVQSLFNVDYSEVVVNIDTTTSGITLNGNYTLTFNDGKTTVEYAFDKLNELSDDGNNADGYKSRVTGTAVVQNGQIVEGNVKLPDAVDFSGISFKQAFFANYTITGAKFEADVTNPRGFTGNSDFVCSKMHVKVLYTQEAIGTMVITYVSEGGSDVSITYSFTK